MQTAKEVLWKTATKAKKRVMVAKDVIAQIKADNIIPSEGTFFHNAMDFKMNQKIKGIFEVGSCEVCAKGALFLSKMQYTNGLAISNVTWWKTEYGPNSFCVTKLGELFTKKQLVMIETAFELQSMDYNDSIIDSCDEVLGKCKSFARELPESERMIAIMKNVIENKGTFKV